MFLGLRTVIYHAPDLAKAKAWYAAAFNVAPYFDEPFYVGFNIGGYELGLNPDASSRQRSAEYYEREPVTPRCGISRQRCRRGIRSAAPARS